MKTRKSPTQENGEIPNGTDLLSSHEHEINDQNETSTLNGSSRETSQESINRHENSEVFSDKLKAENNSDGYSHNVELSAATAKSISLSLQEQKTENHVKVRSNKDNLVEYDVVEEKKMKPAAQSKRDEAREKRIRNIDQGTTLVSIADDRCLRAIDETKKEIKVRILISNRPYYRDKSTNVGRTSGGNETDLGNDGNQHFCQVCRDFGDVVCCDGCPRVYHHDCIPLHSTSRIALDNDDDPWFCPKCIEKKKKLPTKEKIKIVNGVEKVERNSAHRRCIDCEKTRGDLKLLPCVHCGAYIHFPSCEVIATSTRDQSAANDIPVCHNCKVIDQDSMDTDDSEKHVKTNGKKRKSQDIQSDTDGSNVESEDVGPKFVDEGKKKKAKNVRATLMAPNNKNDVESDKKLKKKKKNRKRALSSADQPETEEDAAARQQSIKDDPILQPRGTSTVVQAIPAFCFYLAENRWKIERALSRKHRTFLRLPKGDERNALVAQEAAVWWTNLEPREHKLYINMSIRDFESRVITWKDEKIAKEIMMENDGNTEDFVTDNSFGEGGAKAMDDQYTYDMHERLYLSTSVGSKSCKLEPNHNYNRVLLDLLHDVRFHPLPMLDANRSDVDALLSEENAKVTIPYFEVHGPVSTSIGDECLGCSRGWAHFCSVLQCYVPTVENRAKLQPPLSSLLATRIGLGLRPRNEESNETTTNATEENHELFQWRKLDEANDDKGLFNIPACHVFDPKDRVDDMVLFIEETTAMKIPEPPRPIIPDVNQQKKSTLKALPTQRNREGQTDGDDEAGDFMTHNKCGRCRTMIPNDTGCVPCRRAQLVINKSKGSTNVVPKNGEGKSLKVHTTMLGRLHAKDGTGEIQNSKDQRISEAMLKVRWCPSAILPPQKLYAPTPKISDNGNDDEDEEDLSNSDEDVESMSIEEELDKSYVNESESDKSMLIAKNLLELAGSSDGMLNEDPKDENVPTKRTRAARSMSMVEKEAIIIDPDRPQLQKHYKKETAEIHKKITRIACLGILNAVMRRDPLRIFDEISNGEGGSVPNQIDLKRIRGQLLAGNYDSLSVFVSDIKFLCENAIANNPPTTIYYKTAKEIFAALTIMHSRANMWISTIKGELLKFLQRKELIDRPAEDMCIESHDDPFSELRKTKPQFVAMLDQEDKLRSLVESDFRRTFENETSYYGCLAIGRAAAASEASLAQYPDSCGQHTVVPKRKYYEDEDLRDHIDKKVSEVQPPQLKHISSWREELILRLVRKVQKLRLERLQNIDSGCSRFNALDQSVGGPKAPPGYKAKNMLTSKTKKKANANDILRVSSTRGSLATGLASAKTCQRILQRSKISNASDYSSYKSISDVCVSVRGSKIHGMGLFADQPFSKGEVIAEYVGEYIVNPVSELREKYNEEHRIQDYQFRLDESYVIDATTRGSWARYINHSCTPNCKTIIIPGEETNPHLRRVFIVAKRGIQFNEELTYDYQFPLELDLSARIPCNCHSDSCRGFMNWDLPEKGSNNRVLLVHKRGANMRDRIRRLGRPLKRDEM